MFAEMIPTDARGTKGRWLHSRLRLYPNQQAYCHGDELAERWANRFVIRYDRNWLKRRIKRSLGFKALS